MFFNESGCPIYEAIIFHRVLNPDETDMSPKFLLFSLGSYCQGVLAVFGITLCIFHYPFTYFMEALTFCLASLWFLTVSEIFAWLHSNGQALIDLRW